MKKACICFLTWDRFLYTKQSLQSILDNTDRGSYELLLWDNFSTELGMIDWLRQTCIDNKFYYLFFKRNEGLTRCMNNSMRIMRKIYDFDVYCHIANDVIVPKNWLDGIFEAVSILKVGLIGLNLENKVFEKEKFGDVELEKIEPNGNVGGMHLCMPKKTYDVLKGFREVRFKYGQQDANCSLEVKLLPYGWWDYYLPKDKYKGIHLEEDNFYPEYNQKKWIKLKQSGSDAFAGRHYRDHLVRIRDQYDKGIINEQQLLREFTQDRYLLVDKSQLLETNIPPECIE